MAARGRYMRISNVDRGRLIDAFNGNAQDYLELADNLGINRATARSIVATFLRSGRRETLPRGGATYSKMDEDMRVHLREIIEDNPLLTLEQMKRSLRENLPEKAGRRCSGRKELPSNSGPTR